MSWDKCQWPETLHCILCQWFPTSQETCFKMFKDKVRFHQVTTTPASKNTKPQHTLPTNPSITYQGKPSYNTILWISIEHWRSPFMKWQGKIRKNHSTQNHALWKAAIIMSSDLHEWFISEIACEIRNCFLNRLTLWHYECLQWWWLVVTDGFC